jgi:phosphatidate cytidylyltransferase
VKWGAPLGGAGSGGRQLSNLQIRVISAVVLGIVVLGLTWAGGMAFRLLAVLIAAAIFYEWAAMTRTPGNRPHQWIVWGLLAVVLVATALGLRETTVFGMLLLTLAFAAAHAIASGEGMWTVSGLLYAALSGISLAFLRNADEAGLLAILLLFVVVWATDTFAYFVGRAVGGPRLAPAISPGKTWSGAIGGAVCGTLAGSLFAIVTGSAALAPIIVLSLLLSVVSQVGDLFESWVKRRRGVKDSSNFIPGHGGIMDRVDGLVAAAFALYLIGWVFGNADHPARAIFPV